MKYQCLSESCGKLFMFPAKLVVGLNQAIQDHTEVHACPYCHSIDIEEYVAPPLPQTVEEVANVYIYDLTTGAQSQLDQLLEQGYKIVNRYSKQYHLEKPKPVEVKA